MGDLYGMLGGKGPQQATVSLWSAPASGTTASTADDATNKPTTALRTSCAKPQRNGDRT